ncbi:uncharacterized protein LOC133542122 [Nerophis ophidion]|uniref:uncharacterized protein LOC133542122 n=1 Tax=Nerophis ophidion TaxID=159077 RepID=UPI002ADF2C53|nr:uncharacterized protein LOC133542122 [Nerophis ophidion]
MAFPWTLCLTVAPSSLPGCGSHFVRGLGLRPPTCLLEQVLALGRVRLQFYEELGHRHIKKCRQIWKTARAALLRASERMCRSANRRRIPAPSYTPGQQVLLRAKDLHLQVPSRKLAPRFVGPYTVEAIINPASVRLSLPPSVKRHPVVHVSQIKPVCSSPLSSPDPIPPPPRILDNGDPVWTVKEILGVRRQGRGLVFLVDWEGYGPEDRSWVPASYLADPSLLKNFYQANPGALRRSSGASHKRGGTVMMHTPSASPSPAVAPRGPAVRTARHAPARAAQTAAMRLHSCRQSPINAAGLDERQRHKDSRH